MTVVTAGSLLSDPLGVNATRQRRTWRSSIDFTDRLDPSFFTPPLGVHVQGFTEAVRHRFKLLFHGDASAQVGACWGALASRWWSVAGFD